jgi:acyl-CoA synthetase (AMP-forming)/AMP-acid ligase II
LLAAVIGVAHPKWDERPLLLVKLKDGETASAEEFITFLDGKIARWWMPDDVQFVDEIPLGATRRSTRRCCVRGSRAMSCRPPEPRCVSPHFSSRRGFWLV